MKRALVAVSQRFSTIGSREIRRVGAARLGAVRSMESVTWHRPHLILGVEQNATKDEIHTAFTKMARENHPDLNQDDPDAAAKFVRIKAAYDAIKDGDTSADVRYINPRSAVLTLFLAGEVDRA